MASFLYLLVCLGILVTVHELGHFLAARACGVKVLRFSVGFGQIIYKYTSKKTGCEYALSAIPLGGYVKMEGENDLEDEDGEKKPLSPDSFKAQPLYKRAVIIFAGPFFNIILALLLFTVVNICGVNSRLPVIGDVVPSSAAAQAGFRPYDRIISIDSRETASWKDALYSLLNYIGSDKNVEVKVASDLGKGSSRELQLNLGSLSLTRGQSPLEIMGLRPCVGVATNRIGQVVSGSPAMAASLKAGDIIRKIDDRETDSWYRIQDAITNSGFKPLNFLVLRDGALYSTTVTPAHRKVNGADRPFVGIGAAIEPIDGLSEVIEYDLLSAVVKASDDCLRMSKMVLVSIYKLVNGSISADNISGPISIATGAKESADIGIIPFLIYLALISVNLGIFNLLPVPVLDGGQLLFLAYQAVMKKEPSAAAQKFLTLIGLAILLSLMIFAIFNDIRGLSVSP